jgi:hypothetical protein
MNTSVLSNALAGLGIDSSEAEIFLMTPDPLKTVLIEHFSLKVAYLTR